MTTAELPERDGILLSHLPGITGTDGHTAASTVTCRC